MKNKNKLKMKPMAPEMPLESKEPFKDPSIEAAAKKISAPKAGGVGDMPDVDDNSVDPDEVDEILKKKPKSIADLKKIINAKAMKGKI